MSLQVKDANGATQTVNTLPPVGQAVGAASLPVVLASDQGALQVSAYGPSSSRISFSGAVTTATLMTAIPAQGAGEYAYVTDVDVTNAGSSSFLVQLLNSTSQVLWQNVVPAGGGLTKAFQTPIGGAGQMAANTALTLQASYIGPAGTATITSGTYVSSTGVVTLTLSANAPFTAPETLAVSGLNGTGSYASLQGLFTATSVSTTSVTYQGPTGLGAITLTGGALAYSPVPNLYANLNGYRSAS